MTQLPDTAATFADLHLSADLVQVVRELGFSTPTPVQAKTIPLLLEGKDVIGQSATGSGKTAAFALPLLEKMRGNLRDRRVRALILCPTRELCAQVAREIRKLGRRHPGLQVLVIAGGSPIGPQLSALEKGVHVVVGTPGRLRDHLVRGSIDLGSLETVVLDEADRMLEMGFEEDMAHILAETPESRQTVLFSATFPRTIEALSREYQKHPSRVTIDQGNATVGSIRQVVYEVESADRLKALLWVLEQSRPESTIVFCNFKASVAALARDLARLGVSAGALHGDLEQFDRDRVMAKFRNRSLSILIATDVAARGIDVDALDAVVNFELPQQPEIYVHRVGRTGRAGRKGLAISFAGAREKSKVRMIEEYADTEITEKQASSLRDLDVESLAERLTREGGGNERGARGQMAGADAAAGPGTAPMRTLVIGGGRKDKMRPGDILGALTGEAGGLKGVDIGKIEIHDRFSYVAVAAPVAAVALERLRNGRIKGRKFRIDAVR